MIDHVGCTINHNTDMRNIKNNVDFSDYCSLTHNFAPRKEAQRTRQATEAFLQLPRKNSWTGDGEIGRTACFVGSLLLNSSPFTPDFLRVSAGVGPHACCQSKNVKIIPDLVVPREPAHAFSKHPA